MSEMIKPLASWCAALLEAFGIGIIAVLAFYSIILAAVRMLRGDLSVEAFSQVRQRLGHAILLGLEFLVAADIIHTVAVELNFTTVGVLAVIVLIRTFLSFTLDVELTGRWPWQQKKGMQEKG